MSSVFYGDHVDPGFYRNVRLADNSAKKKSYGYCLWTGGVRAVPDSGYLLYLSDTLREMDPYAGIF